MLTLQLQVNAETSRALDDALDIDRNKQLDRLNKEMSYWVDMGYTNSNLQYGLLMQNLEELEASLVEEELVTLERDVLVHIEQLGALKSSFGESMSTATLRTQTSYEPDYALLDEIIINPDPETKADDDDTQVIVRSGKSEERKLKRMRASEKASGVVPVKLSNKRRPRKSRKSSSSQFISNWKIYQGLRRSILREQSALLVAIKVRTNVS
jgi:RNA polymerase sigma factor